MRAAVVLPLAALLLSACAGGPAVTADPGVPQGSWTTVPSAPISPRLDAVTAWTGTEALVLGADQGATDGAAYDPRTQTWRLIAEAPYPVSGDTPRAVSGDTVHLVHDDRLLSYDASEDAWSVSPPAPERDLGTPAVLDDGTVVVADLAYDPATRLWAELPGHAAEPEATETGSGSWPVPPPPGAPDRPGSTVWMGDDLLVLGGADAGHLSAGAWLWHPGGVDS